MRLEGWHLIIIVALAVLLFGAPKLPGLARSVGQSLRIFKSEVKQMKEDGNDPTEGHSSAAAQIVGPSSGAVPPGAADTIGRSDSQRDAEHATSVNHHPGAPTGTTAPTQFPPRA